MRKRLFLVLSLLLIGLLCGYLFSRTLNVSSRSVPKGYTGYLVCQSCGETGQSMDCDGVDIRKCPEMHTVNCLRMYTCVTSGFGIFIKNTDGSYRYCKFDKKGSDLAYKNIVAQTKKTDHLQVEVTGKLLNDTISVESISER